ncbi:MAG: YiiD C-terminal domain-containing protein, partial [Pseudomonadota bacterium]
MKTEESRVESRLRELLPLYKHIDLTIESVSGGVFRCKIPLNEANKNHFGTVHAALQFAVAEVLGGLVGESLGVLNDQHVGVVKNFEIHFKKPATTDVIAETRMPVGDLTALAERIEADGRVDFDLEA